MIVLYEILYLIRTRIPDTRNLTQAGPIMTGSNTASLPDTWSYYFLPNFDKYPSNSASRELSPKCQQNTYRQRI